MSLTVALPLFFLFDVVTNVEEIGWRGYALPRLQTRYCALVASLVVGGVGAFWHLPKLLTEGGPGYPIWLFVLETTAKAVLFTWVFNGTAGSLLSVSLLHSSVVSIRSSRRSSCPSGAGQHDEPTGCGSRVGRLGAECRGWVPSDSGVVLWLGR